MNLRLDAVKLDRAISASLPPVPVPVVDHLAEPTLELLPIAAIAVSETHIQTARRARFNPDALVELADSIRAVGVLQPIQPFIHSPIRGGRMAELSSTITVKFDEPVVALPSRIVARMLERIFDDAPPTIEQTTRRAAPDQSQLAIGAEYEGGLYAGLTLHEGQPHRLVLLPGDQEDFKWQDAVTWAEKQGGTLPSRIDQLVLWQNMKTQFQSAAYWSCEQHASSESSAWYQSFGNGLQSYYDEYGTLRARAVRRIPIE